MNALSPARTSKVDFVPVRWWQVIDFIRLNLAVVKGHDPWADRILAKPWSLFSLMEYAYMVITFPVSNAYFVVVDGERAGVVWTMNKLEVGYILSIGLLPQFQVRGIGLRIAYFLEEHAEFKRIKAAVARIAIQNKPIARMVQAFGGRDLGLATTELIIPNVPLPPPSPGITLKQSTKSAAASAWRRWKVYAVGHTSSGSAGAKVATDFLEAFGWMDSMPRGKYLTLDQDGQEVGFAIFREREGKAEVYLLTSADLWSGPQTAEVLATLSPCLSSPIHFLEVVQKHADALDSSPPFEFERRWDQERHFVFWTYPFPKEPSRTRPREEE